jgi:hypothetical protein
MKTTQKEKEMMIRLNIEELGAREVRLLKTMSALMVNVLTAEDESEYFDSSAELFRKAAELIHSSHFAKSDKQMDYGTQALEYAVDYLNEISEVSNKSEMDN